MSQLLINEYLNELATLKRASGANRESWVLDQHKEKTPRAPTVREKFNTYRFADHQEAVVDMLARVVTVSIQIVAITDAMAALPASARELKKADA